MSYHPRVTINGQEVELTVLDWISDEDIANVISSQKVDDLRKQIAPMTVQIDGQELAFHGSIKELQRVINKSL